MIDWTTLAVFVVLFGAVTVLGFMAANFQRGDLSVLHEWALGGRRFGTLITWFLLGGDIYTAYTFVALPALVFGLGAPAFFALWIACIAFPMVFVFAPRFWTIAHKRHYITYADFAKDRFDSRSLELVVAATGIVATMLYISLQLVGLQVVIKALGFTGSGWSEDVPVIVAFAILAAYTYRGGLRAPALVAIVKDVLIYVTVIAAIIVIPPKLGGFAHIFAAADAVLAHAPKPGSIILAPSGYTAYATLAIGSGLALFMYPHSITSTLCAKNQDIIRRNMALMPAYAILLGILALFGYMALSAGMHPSSPNDVVPMLIKAFFPSWFVGVALAAIGMSALVPAAVMSIAAANTFTRNIHSMWAKVPLDERQETSLAKLASLIVKTGALVAVLFLPTQYSIYYQLFAGALILQTLPTILIGLYTAWFHKRALLVGWAAGMLVALWMMVANHFSSTYPLHLLGMTIPAFIGIYALLANLLTTFVLTVVFDRFDVPRGTDRTLASDYLESPSA
jgi:SSS family solute:Na+ symporter